MDPYLSLAQEAEMNAVQPSTFVEDAETFPRGGTDAEIWEFLLRYAVRAPSGHNTHPWRFHIADDQLHLYADRGRALPVVDPEDRELVMSCGAALAHVIVALRHFGYAGEVTVFPDPADRDLLATIGLGRAHTPRRGDHQLFKAIDNRHTHRAAFETRPIPDTVLTQLGRDTHRAGATLHVFTGDEAGAAIATLVAEGDRAQFDDAGFRHELAAWIRPNRTRRPDGMPGYAFGISDLPSLLGPTMVAAFNTGASQARKDEQLVLTAPALLVLTTAGDTPADWLTAGQAVGVLLLRAAAHDLSASFLNQPIEVPALRARLRDLVDPGRCPQLLLRTGYPATTDRPTPRRAVADVLTDAPTSTATSP
jgi:nitroreductase